MEGYPSFQCLVVICGHICLGPYVSVHEDYVVFEDYLNYCL